MHIATTSLIPVFQTVTSERLDRVQGGCACSDAAGGMQPNNGQYGQQFGQQFGQQNQYGGGMPSQYQGGTMDSMYSGTGMGSSYPGGQSSSVGSALSALLQPLQALQQAIQVAQQAIGQPGRF